MSSYEKDAEYHAKQIKHLYDNAGSTGYSQAERHYSKLGELIGQALRSKHNKNDAVVIKLIKESCTPMMDEMRPKNA
jgi:hypothetical protein